MNYDTKKWIYEFDSEKNIRYVLGIKGEKPLLCFGINPSTAKPEQLDNTLKSVERLAFNNGYDSWIMMNVYPQRSTNPDNLHFKIDTAVQKQNLKFIKKIVTEYPTDIWAAWGTLIEKRPYLMDCLFQIYESTIGLDCNWVSIGKKTKFGHPHHPLYLNSLEKIAKFDIINYIKKLKNNLN